MSLPTAVNEFVENEIHPLLPEAKYRADPDNDSVDLTMPSSSEFGGLRFASHGEAEGFALSVFALKRDLSLHEHLAHATSVPPDEKAVLLDWETFNSEDGFLKAKHALFEKIERFVEYERERNHGS